jgi:glycosyltransferase involved in cell wall biosynthesis
MVPTSALTRAREEFPAVQFYGTKIPNHALAVRFALGRLARSIRADAVLSQNFTTPGALPANVFVHDVLFRSNPEWFSRKERLYLSFISRGLRSRPRVFTSSTTEAARIRSFYPRVEEVVAVGLGASPSLFTATSDPPRRVPPEFLLSVGRLNVRKNLGAVVRAHAELTNDGVDLAPLVVVGPAAGLEFDSLGEASSQVSWLGAVSDGELRWLYENAIGLVFATLDEGFGLPPVEALAFGCPVLVSDIPVMHEVVGAQGAYFDPVSPKELKSGLRELNVSRRREPVSPAAWSDVVASIRKAIRVRS